MFNHILVPLDGSELAECVLPHVRVMADVMGSKVTLLHSVERLQTSTTLYPVNPLDWHMRRTEADRYLKKMAAKLLDTISHVDVVVVEGSAAENVIEYTQNNSIDLMILSSHGRSGLSCWNISSVVQKIIRRSYTSTLIVRAYAPGSDVSGYGKIMVGLDCSNRAENAIPAGIMLTKDQNAELILAHVVKTPEMPRRLPPTAEDIKLSDMLVERNYAVANEYMVQLASQFAAENISIKTNIIIGKNVMAALDGMIKSEGVELVILNAHGYEGDGNWPYGSIAVNFIAYGTIPLLIMQDIPHAMAKKTSAEEAVGESFGH